MEYCGGGSLQDIYQCEFHNYSLFYEDDIHVYMHVSPSIILFLLPPPPSLSFSLSISLATGSGLNELQIAFVCREILRVSRLSMFHACTIIITYCFTYRACSIFMRDKRFIEISRCGMCMCMCIYCICISPF
jgi:hypothetical protein